MLIINILRFETAYSCRCSRYQTTFFPLSSFKKRLNESYRNLRRAARNRTTAKLSVFLVCTYFYCNYLLYDYSKS